MSVGKVFFVFFVFTPTLFRLMLSNSRARVFPHSKLKVATIYSSHLWYNDSCLSRL